MSFLTDKQTLDDLGLLGKFNQRSIFALFNKVVTAGGEHLLEEMFRNPMTDFEAINQRSVLFRYFQEQDLRFPFDRASFDVVENYLRGGAPGTGPGALVEMVRKKMLQQFLHDEQYAKLQAGLIATIRALRQLKELVAKLEIPMLASARAILCSRPLEWLMAATATGEPTMLAMSRMDRLLRNTLRKEMETLLHAVYSLDVYVAVSGVARSRDFSYAAALPASQNCFHTTALRHPGLDAAVANPLHLRRDGNVLFLTGANMAGKSTFMKSFGIAVYLAHMGFPVAARDMQFSVMDGLYSSINVADNINQGYSHFYAEVLRVKKVAEEVSSGKNLVVLFDELFKGTNVKDAYDATLSVTAAFARYRNCFFVISTHIIEVGEALKKQQASILFSYFPTVMGDAAPRYTYTITAGITSDRQGMVIIEKEGILELL